MRSFKPLLPPNNRQKSYYRKKLCSTDSLVRLALYDSDKTVGLIEEGTREFSLKDPIFPYSEPTTKQIFFKNIKKGLTIKSQSFFMLSNDYFFN